MKIIKIRKLFRGFVSVRSYIIEAAKEKKEDLKIYLDDDFMIIPYEKLNEGKPNGMRIRSKHGNKVYDLIDYIWKTDESQKRLV